MTNSVTDPKTNLGRPSCVPGPPTKHQMAVMIWLAVFPTLSVLNLALGDGLRTLNPILRTFILATIAVPIISYALMPQLHRLRRNLLTRNANG
jgi:antibiotic biosynthesis monooxygenase (ABM) superfamily enzyme